MLISRDKDHSPSVPHTSLACARTEQTPVATQAWVIEIDSPDAAHGLQFEVSPSPQSNRMLTLSPSWSTAEAWYAARESRKTVEGPEGVDGAPGANLPPT